MLIIVSNMFEIKGQGFTLAECTQAAEQGVFIAQVDLAFLYYSGYSTVLGTHPKDYVKSMLYFHLALMNTAANGKETKKLKAKCMAHLALLYGHGELYDSKLSSDKDKAFFWAYAALSNGFNSDNSEELYQSILSIAVSKMCEYAKIDKRFANDFMYLRQAYTGPITTLIDKTYKVCVKKGYVPSEALHLKQRRDNNGYYKYIGEVANEKPNGLGILLRKVQHTVEISLKECLTAKVTYTTKKTGILWLANGKTMSCMMA